MAGLSAWRRVGALLGRLGTYLLTTPGPTRWT